jgi:hypothetical protein
VPVPANSAVSGQEKADKSQIFYGVLSVITGSGTGKQEAYKGNRLKEYQGNMDI